MTDLTGPPSQVALAIGVRIMNHRKDKNMSVIEMADRLAVSRGMLYRIEAGFIVKLADAEAIAYEMNISLSKLVEVRPGVEYGR